MNQKVKKPIPKSMILAFLCLPIGIGVQVYYHMLLGITLVLLGVLIIALNIWLSRCSGIFIPDRYKKKSIERYKEFAYFYLRDRGLNYTQTTFEIAVANKWTDVVTMCLLLGISKALPIEEKMAILKNVFKNEDLSTFKILLKAGFNSNKNLGEKEEPMLFLAMNKEDVGYVDALLDSGVSTNLENNAGERAIFVAIRENRKDIVASLIKHKVELKNVTHEGLNPMFFALAQENFEICEIIFDNAYKSKKDKINGPKIEEIDGRIILEGSGTDSSNEELLMQLIATKDRAVWHTLKDIFNDKSKYNLSEKKGVELYARLSYITGEYTLHTNKSKKPKTTYSKELCHQDLVKKVKKSYKLSDIGRYKIDHIYQEPKCIESNKETCETCKGKGEINCQVCAGKGTSVCPDCHGDGKAECKKCHGTGKVSCKMVKEQAICRTCKEGVYTCLRCDEHGEAICQTCKGHGTVKCKCPPNRRKPCPHCEKGFVEVKKGQYVKCRKCKDGYICTDCNNTGWRLLDRAKAQDLCPTCGGKKRVKCTQCNGTKKVKCTKAYVRECDCNKGVIQCETCKGTKKIECTTCGGTGKQKCLECESGYVYKNIYLDFNCTNYLAKEGWFGEKEGQCFLKNMSKNLIKDLLEGISYADKVYSLTKQEIRPEHIIVNNSIFERQIKAFLEKKEKHNGLVEILEIVPLPYRQITVKHDSGKQHNYLFVKDNYVKVVKSDFINK